MAKGVRFTKPERTLIREVLAVVVSDWDGNKDKKLAASIAAKLDESEAPPGKSRDCLTVGEAITAFRSVLDRRLVAPPNGAGLVYIQMQAKLKSLALTREQCIQAATQAGSQWPQGNIKAESIIRQAESLLHNYESAPLPMEGRSDYETRDTSGMTDL